MKLPFIFIWFIEVHKVAGWMHVPKLLKVVTWWILVSDTETSCSQFWNLDRLSTLWTCFIRIILHSELPMIKSAPLLLLHVEMLGATDHQPYWNGISKEVSMVLRIGIVLDYITRISTMFARRAGICKLEWVEQKLLHKSRVHWGAKLKRWTRHAALNPAH